MKVFLGDQCKERKTIEWERLEISSRKLEIPRKYFMQNELNKGSGIDLTEAEGVKKRWQEYTELYKKGLNDPDNHNGVVPHLESDILECEVKSALGSSLQTKLVEVMEFQLNYFKS